MSICEASQILEVVLHHLLTNTFNNTKLKSRYVKLSINFGGKEAMTKLKWNNNLSEKERDRRWQLVRDYMQSKGMDGLLALGGGVWHVDNGRFVQHQTLDRYLSGWVSGGTVVFPIKGDPTLLGAPFATVLKWTPETPKEELPWIEDIRTGAAASAIVEAIKEKGLERGHVGVGNISQVGGMAGPERWTSTVWGTGLVWSQVVHRLP